MPARRALAMPYLLRIGEQLERSGVSMDLWLAAADLSRAQLEDERFVLDAATFMRLAIDGAALSNEPAFGLLLGERMGVLDHGSLGYAAVNSRSVREVLALAQRYLGLRITMLSLQVVEQAGEVRVMLSERVPLGPIRSFVLEAAVFSVKNLLEDVSTGHCQALRVAFAFGDQGYADLAETLLRAPVHYDQPWTGLALPIQALDVPLKTADPRAFRQAEALCHQQLVALQANDTWAARVQRVLLEARVGYPSLEETARRLGVTPRTLHRRLVAEGTAYRAILDAVRCRAAVQHLSAGDASIAEVAYLLGYTDPANFRRAFRRWTGLPPTRYLAERRGVTP